MQSKVTYDIIKVGSQEIIIRKFFGSVNLDDIISSFKFISENMLNEKKAGVVTDFIDAYIDFGFADLREIVNYIKSDKKISILKLAVVVDSPKKVIFPMMVQNNNPDLGIKPFSSKDAAIKWILE